MRLSPKLLKNRFLTSITSLCFVSLALPGVLGATGNKIVTEKQLPSPNESDLIRIVPVKPTPESEAVETRIVFPQARDMQTKNPLDVQIRLEGYPLRTYSQFPRAKEVMNYNKTGQSLHVVVDNEPYFAENEAIVDALDSAMDYYDQMLEFDLPMDLSPGMHTLRIFPARSYGESLKGDGCFVARAFNFRSKTPLMDIDLTQPYLTANQPQGELLYDPKKPVLLDFYITNVLLSRDGYKVRVTIDNTIQRIIIDWVPYYMYGLKPGNHKIKLELLDPENKVVPGMFNTVERQFYLRNGNR